MKNRLLCATSKSDDTSPNMPLPFLLRFAVPGMACLATGLFASGIAASDHPVVALWPQGAPGSEARMNEPEKVTGTNVTNIHHPSLTVYLPVTTKATGCAVVIAPGGAHARLAIQHEGYNVAQWLADHGIAAFVLKYRLAKDEATPTGVAQTYTIDRDELADGQRALQLVRSRAEEWGVNTAKVGIIGFSAGGEVALLAATRSTAAKTDATDPLARFSSRPDFFGLVYPGGLPRTDIILTKDTPPAFLVCGADDRPTISELLPEFYLKCKKAGIPAELHIYAGAGHGFGVRSTNHSPSGAWIDRFSEWLSDRKFVTAAAQ
jgi:acetyl esterase/lipase